MMRAIATWRLAALALLYAAARVVLAAPVSEICEFPCGDGQCVGLFDRCDNVRDCNNGRDEDDCHYLHSCPPNTFMCRSGECIPKSAKCDGNTDCTDGSDERSCPAIPLLSNLPSSADFEHGESHAPITYQRSTRPPPKTNKAKCEQSNATLYYSSDANAIYRTRPLGGRRYETKLVLKKPYEFGAIRSLSMDYAHEQLLYVTDKQASQVHVYEPSRGDSLLLEDHLHRFSAVAKDWITGNLYYTEDGMGIGVCVTDKKVVDGQQLACMALVEEASGSQSHRYRDLILHPKRGVMMWVQDEPMGVLKIAGMDGVKVRTLSGFEHVHAIAFDYERERLFIAEGDEVDVMDIRTLQRKAFAPIMPAAMAVFGCDLYYVDRTNGYLKKYEDDDMDEHVATLSGFRFTLATADANHTLAAAERETNPCEVAGCSEFCTLTESALETSARCLCVVCQTVDDNDDGDMEMSASALGWFVTAMLLAALICSTSVLVIYYFNLSPAFTTRVNNMCTRRGDKLNDSNISAAYNNSLYEEPAPLK